MINDLLLLHLAGRHPELALFYALDSTLGSVAGAFAMYGLSHHGSRFLRRNAPPSQAGRAQHWLERNDFVTVLVASLLPPPAPFKIVPIVAGAVSVNAARFGAALVLGRGLRFAFEAFVGMRYGGEAEAYLKRHLVSFSLAMAAFILVAWTLYRYWQKRGERLGQRPAAGGPAK